MGGVSLEVREGEVVALAGANGSGKTTLLKILAGQLARHAGDAAIFGHDPARNFGEIARLARFAFAPPALFEELTALEHVVSLGRLTGAVSRADALEALAKVDLVGRERDRVKTFSFGMRQRLSLATCLVPRPRLLVLDEPTDGLDPLGVIELAALLKRLAKDEGISILVAQHHFAELQSIVDRVVVLDAGRVILEGDPQKLRSERSRVEIRAGNLDALRVELERQGFAPVHEDGRLHCPPGSLDHEAANAAARAAGTQLTDFHLALPSFEEVLVSRLGETRIQSPAPSVIESQDNP